jgi:transcriptional regulator with XRE-family HTH domain
MGISARDMSLSLGESENYIDEIEQRKSIPCMESFLSICEFFKVTPGEFFDKENLNPALLNHLVKELIPLSGTALDDLMNLFSDVRDRVKKDL